MSKALKTLSPEQCTKLLAWIQERLYTYNPKVRNHKAYTMTLLMLDAGLRVGELVQLKVDDLWIESHPVQTLVVREDIAKNHRERAIPLTDRLIEALHIMHTMFPHWQNPEKKRFAFWSYFADRPPSVRTVQIMIARASFYSLGEKIHPHVLRHTFATRLMRQTNIRVVQKLLGHSSLSSTQVYTHPNSDDLSQAIKSLED